jgi:hypothetical protein
MAITPMEHLFIAGYENRVNGLKTFWSFTKKRSTKFTHSSSNNSKRTEV